MFSESKNLKNYFFICLFFYDKYILSRACKELIVLVRVYNANGHTVYIVCVW